MNLSILILVFFVFIFSVKNKIINKDILIEGLVIGIISGIFISYATDTNYRATIHGPVVKYVKWVNNNARYSSQDWTDIKITKTGNVISFVSAKNIASGNTVEFTSDFKSKLPADLRYDILTNNNAGGSTVEFK